MTHTVAITGAGGFIGAQAAQRYAAMGWQVRGLDLPGISQPHVHETLTGNITDPDALAQLVNGADLVLHTAAIVAESGDWSAFHQPLILEGQIGQFAVFPWPRISLSDGVVVLTLVVF